ncbi:acyltransferase [Mucilaginibacter robiniae]|uniref:Acyltransferase n=1 Tax=Mucilaginibacter robiniae TaxID=2728022 RepID=A0A7L5DUM6_9SPHI|nr:acyltransferase [Mucilaginibacter robiniae]QJD94411.1 acyltransferase [Mucilaginibacter robiniae]
MQKIIVTIFKVLRRIDVYCSGAVNQLLCKILFYIKNVQHANFKTEGLPYVSIATGGTCVIGSGLDMNNTLSSNPIGRPQPCVFFVDKNAQLIIGSNVGMSQAALICHSSITIGNDVKLGGGVCVYDTDFHSIIPEIRKSPALDLANRIKKPVIISDNAFIGAHSTILKGVTIGKNSVVGACSLVTKDIPDNQVWAGNPAKLIKVLSEQEIVSSSQEQLSIV